MYGWKTEDQFSILENADRKLQDRKIQDLRMQDLKLKDHFVGLENAGPEKEDQKESGWKLKDHSRSYNKAKCSCTRRSKATDHSITLRNATR